VNKCRLPPSRIWGPFKASDALSSMCRKADAEQVFGTKAIVASRVN
jgi:hypothetical protein